MHKVFKFGRRPVARGLLVVILFAVVFAGGFRVGRGDWSWQRAEIASSSSQSLDYNSLNQVYRILKDNFDGTLDSVKLLDGAKAGLVNAAGDPFTEYFNPSEAEDFDNQLNN